MMCVAEGLPLLPRKGHVDPHDYGSGSIDFDTTFTSEGTRPLILRVAGDVRASDRGVTIGSPHPCEASDGGQC